MITQSPCKGCCDRTVTPNCHSTCAKYIAYRKYQDEKNLALKKEREEEQRFAHSTYCRTRRR